MLAGVAIGAFADHRTAVKQCVKPIGVTVPDAEGVAFYDREFKRYLRIQRALAPIYQDV